MKNLKKLIFSFVLVFFIAFVHADSVEKNNIDDFINVRGMDLNDFFNAKGNIYICDFIEKMPSSKNELMEYGKIRFKIIKTIFGEEKENITLPYVASIKSSKYEHDNIWFEYFSGAQIGYMPGKKLL